jgi:hypothetical protein
MYRLKVPVEKITFEQWEMILETLRGFGDLNYKILKNDEEPLEDWYGVSILHLIYLITTSPRYNIDDEYVLEDGVDNILISGDEKSILEVLSPHFKDAIARYIAYLDIGVFYLPHMLENVFEEDERE